MGSEQRRYRRCMVVDGQDSVVLSMGGESYQGDLVNISADGFGVVIPEMPVPKQNQLVELECRTGRQEARVVRWEPINGMIQVGLTRVRDILEERPPEPMPEQKLLEKRERLAPASVLLAISLCILVLAVAAVIKFGQTRLNLTELLPGYDSTAPP